MGLDYFCVKYNCVFAVHVWKDEFCTNRVSREAILSCKELRASNSFKSRPSIGLLELLSV